MQKRFLKMLAVFALGFFVILGITACKPNNGDDGDVVPPAFLNLRDDGKLLPIEHLEGEEIDLLAGVQARDNVDGYDVTITVDKKDYDKNAAGEYEVEYTAKDSAGNASKVKRVVVVVPALHATINAAVIGDSWVEYIYNDPTAFIDDDGSGANFRFVDKLFIMEKAFYLDQLEEHAENHTKNNGIPIFVYGSIIILNADKEIVHVRMSTGAYHQLDVIDGETVYTYDGAETPLDWAKYDFDAGLAGGNLLKGLDEIIPEGGYLLIAPTPGTTQKSRVFIVANTFASEYEGGVAYKDDRDVENIAGMKVDFVEDYEVVMPLPDPITSPIISIKRHTVSWPAVTNATSYTLLIDGEVVGEPLTVREIDLSTLELELSDDDDPFYEVTVVANSIDIFKYSNSVPSNVIEYIKVETTKIEEAPVLEFDEEDGLLKWELIDGIESYEVYLQIGDVRNLVGETEENFFDPAEITDHNGMNNYSVVGIGDYAHSDSPRSNLVLVDQYEFTPYILGDHYFDVVVIEATDYFIRRNLSDETKLGQYIYMLVNIDQVPDDVTVTEAFSTNVLLNENMEAKWVRPILAGKTYSQEEGWFNDSSYNSNSAQLVGIDNVLATGDILLIGKNALTITYVEGGEEKTVPARDFLAYHYMKAWDFGTTEGWRETDNAKLIDAKEVVLEIDTDIKPLFKPTVTYNGETKLLEWNELNGAIEYEVYLNPGYKETVLLATVTTTSFDVYSVDEYQGFNTYYVKAIGDENHKDSPMSDAVDVARYTLETYQLGEMVFEVAMMNAVEYFSRRNYTDKYKLANYIYMVTDLGEVEYKLTATSPGLGTENASANVLLDSDLKAKWSRGIIAMQKYTAANGWEADPDYAVNNAQLGGLEGYLADGDVLLIGKNGLTVTYQVGEEEKTAPARDFIAYHYMKPWDTLGATGGEGWRGSIDTFVDSKEVILTKK